MSLSLTVSHGVEAWRGFWATAAPDPRQQAARIRLVERNIGLPVKGVAIAALVYSLFFYHWFGDAQAKDVQPTVQISVVEVALEVVQRFFLIYLVLNVGVGAVLLGMRQFPVALVENVVFGVCLLDGLFLAALTVVTGGFDSVLFWAYLGLVMRNAVSVAAPTSQIVLSLIMTVSYLVAGLIDVTMMKITVSDKETELLDPNPEPFMLRIILLLLLTACCCGLRVLFDRQRRSEDEALEFAQRQEQLQAAGRLAAEIAHQLKNPLGIINNAAFTLQRTVKEGGKTITQQIKIIREEVGRSDRIITELMGYARLVEGRLEKLDVVEELESAIAQVFPPAVKYEVEITRDYAPALPVLFLQRNHLSEIFVNILQNAREAMNAKGHIGVRAAFGENYTVLVQIEDDGPGIPHEQQEKVFEPYFTTKESGTGLGLAIVKHNTEIYGGKVRIESELGRGTRFVLQFPARALIKLRR